MSKSLEKVVHVPLSCSSETAIYSLLSI